MSRKRPYEPILNTTGISSGASEKPLSPESPEEFAAWVKRTMTPRDWFLFRQAVLYAIGEHPHPGQQAIHNAIDRSRFNLLTGGERSGKSRFAAQYVASRCIAPFLYAAAHYRGEKTRLQEVYKRISPIVWLVGNTYSDAEEEFTYLVEMMTTAGFVPEPVQRYIQTPKEGAWEMSLVYGGLIATRSVNDSRRMSKISPDIIVLCEAAQQNDEIVRRARTRISQTRGVLLLVGTHEPGAEWFAQLYEEWLNPNNSWGAQAFSMPTWENTVAFPGGREDPEIRDMEQNLPTETFLERIAAVPIRRVGRVIPEFGEDNVSRHAVYVAGEPVYIAADPGWSADSPYAILAIQKRQAEDGRTLFIVFDEIYQSYATGMQMAKAVCEAPWWRDVTAVVMDIAARQHHSGPSQEEIWLRTFEEIGGKQVPIYTRKVTNINTLIDAYRVVVRNPVTRKPQLWVNPNCKNFIREHSLWCYPPSRGLSGRTNITPPDKYNHAIKAICYFVLNLQEGEQQRPIIIPWRTGGRNVDSARRGQRGTLPQPFLG